MSETPALTDLEKSIFELRDSLQAGTRDHLAVSKKLMAVNVEVGKLLTVSRRNPPMYAGLVALLTDVNDMNTGVSASDEPKVAKALEEALATLDELKARSLSQKNL